MLVLLVLGTLHKYATRAAGRMLPTPALILSHSSNTKLIVFNLFTGSHKICREMDFLDYTSPIFAINVGNFSAIKIETSTKHY